MSECVVRMERVPKNCDDGCWGRLSGECPWCDSIDGYKMVGNRPPNCPIIAVLPKGHGRLVDEKEVKDWVENWLCVNKYYHPYSSSKSIPVSDLYDVLQRMDAAVFAEAERSET